MATLKTQPVKTSKTPTAPSFSQKYSDEEYRKKYGTGQAATEARIRAVMTHRGRTPTAGRISDIYKRRQQEFNTKGYGALREWAGPPKVAPGAKGTGDKKPTVQEARATALQDAIAAIRAQFGMQNADLMRQQGGLGNIFKLQSSEIDRESEQMKRQTIEDAVRRGIGRSSIYAGNMADVIGQEKQARSTLAQEYGTQKTTGKAGSRARALESAIKLLGQQRLTAEQQAKSQSAKGELDLETLLALVGTGISGTNFLGQ